MERSALRDVGRFLFTMFGLLGLPTYGVRACAKVRDDKEKLSQTVQELLIISGITTAVTYVVFFVSLFVIPEFAAERKLLMGTALSIGLTSIGVQWLYNALEQYFYITTCALAFKVIGMALMFILIRQPEDLCVVWIRLCGRKFRLLCDELPAPV